MGTLRHALIEEILLVTPAHVIFLMHFRSIFIVTLPLPLAVLCSFLLMHYAGVTSNVVSLAGVAIAIGVLVDAGIVVTENAFRHLEGVDTNDRGALMETVLRATKLVGRDLKQGQNDFVLQFRDQGGQPVDVGEVTARIEHEHAEHGANVGRLGDPTNRTAGYLSGEVELRYERSLAFHRELERTARTRQYRVQQQREVSRCRD